MLTIARNGRPWSAASPLRRLSPVVALFIVVLLTACSSGTTASPAGESVPPDDPGASPELSAPAAPSPSDDEPSPSASEETADAGLEIPIESPCAAMDAETAEELIGGPVETERTFEPGDQPFGAERPPTANYGCQFIGAVGEGGNAPEFGLSMAGEATTAEDWEARMSSSLSDCRDLDVPEGLEGDLVAAVVCASVPGWNNVIVHGVFGGTALMCAAYVPEDRVDEAYEADVVGECERIILELAGESEAAGSGGSGSASCLPADVLAALEAYKDVEVPADPTFDEVADALEGLELDERAAGFRDGVVEVLRDDTYTLDVDRLHDMMFSLLPLQSEVDLVEC